MHHFHVWFLGWEPSMGLRGEEFTQPVVRKLLSQRRAGQIPRIKLKVRSRGIVIKHDGVRASVPAEDITFVSREPFGNVVACIYFGYDARTQCAVHVHAYQCESNAEFVAFYNAINQLVTNPRQQRRLDEVEADLIRGGYIVNPRQLGAPIANPHLERLKGRGRAANGAPNEEDAVKSAFRGINEELQFKMNPQNRKGPILLPPADYDTIVRRRGDLRSADQRRCLRPSIVGARAIYERPTLTPEEEEAASRQTSIQDVGEIFDALSLFPENGSTDEDDEHALRHATSSSLELRNGADSKGQKRGRHKMRPIEQPVNRRGWVPD